MADNPVSGKPDTPKKKGTFGFLSYKLFGVVPVWVAALAGVGIYYWYTHYGPGASKAAAKQPRAQRPQVVVVDGGKRGRPGPSGPQRPPSRRGKPRKPPGGSNPPGQQTAQVAQVAPTPVYDQYASADLAEMPEPMEAYAPMTAGAIYA